MVNNVLSFTMLYDFKIMFLGYSRGSVILTLLLLMEGSKLKAQSSKQQNLGFSLILELSALSLLGTRNRLFCVTRLC